MELNQLNLFSLDSKTGSRFTTLDAKPVDVNSQVNGLLFKVPDLQPSIEFEEVWNQNCQIEMEFVIEIISMKWRFEMIRILIRKSNLESGTKKYSLTRLFVCFVVLANFAGS